MELRLGHGQLSAAVCVQHLAAAAGERRRAAPFRAVLHGHSYRIHVLPLRLAGCAVGDAAQRRGADGQRAAAAGVAPHLLLSLLAQSLTGLLLGAGIQRQRELNQQLRLRLAENRQLARALVTAEQTRREVARELHDEWGRPSP